VHQIGWTPRDPIEVDETFIRGKPHNMHRSKRLACGDQNHKAIVMGCWRVAAARFGRR
jgi:hypothetical protein